MNVITASHVRARLAAHPVEPDSGFAALWGVQLAEDETAWNPQPGQPAITGRRYVIYAQYLNGHIEARSLLDGDYRHEGDAHMVAAHLRRAGLTVRIQKRRSTVLRDQHGHFFPLRVTVAADCALLDLLDEAELAEGRREPGTGYLVACPACGRTDPPVTTLGDATGATVTDCCDKDVTTLI